MMTQREKCANLFNFKTSLKKVMLTPLITPRALHEQFPLSSEHKGSVSQHRKIAKHIFCGKDERLLILVGPCSIHDSKIALEYAQRLKDLSDKVSDRIFLIMRVFLEKPRTQFGWKGYIYDPFLDGSDAIEEGLIASWKLLRNLLSVGVPIATEFLDPILSSYTQDTITWGMIGARTTSSQIHRQVVSQLPMPIGFKNDTHGNLDHAIYGALAARHPQLSLSIDEKGRVCFLKTTGNPLTHITLRGALQHTNYDHRSVSQATQKQCLYGLDARLLIDCAHGNSKKDCKEQQHVFVSVLEQIQEGNHLIMGMMLESTLQGGHLMSITDPCLDWGTTESLILWAHKSLKNPLKFI